MDRYGHPKDVFRTQVFVQVEFFGRLLFTRRLQDMRPLKDVNLTEMEVLKTSLRYPKYDYFPLPSGIVNFSIHKYLECSRKFNLHSKLVHNT